LWDSVYTEYFASSRWLVSRRGVLHTSIEYGYDEASEDYIPNGGDFGRVSMGVKRFVPCRVAAAAHLSGCSVTRTVCEPSTTLISLKALRGRRWMMSRSSLRAE
jgi:hypothetical protein